MSIHPLIQKDLDPFGLKAQEIFASRENSELVFYCFKGQKSSTQTDKSTKVTTTTTTNIRDIGLTGKDAIEIAAVLARGVELTTRAVGDIIVPITNSFATAAKAREETFATTARAREQTEQVRLAPQIIAAESQKSPGQLISENLPLIALGVGAVVVFGSFIK